MSLSGGVVVGGSWGLHQIGHVLSHKTNKLISDNL